MTLEDLYRHFPENTEIGEKSKLVLIQTNWFASIAEFDPRTSDALTQPLSCVLRNIAYPEDRHLPDDEKNRLKDRLFRIVKHARPSLEKLLDELNESPRREQAIMSLRSVRDLDTTSFMALSRRPGRTVREKLAGKPYLQAVRHYLSIDLPENRLLKAVAERLLELLELREQYLGEDRDGLSDRLQSWLRSDVAGAIGRWENLPPNNTLLTHRHYRAIYDAWTWLQTLDEDLNRDFEHLEERAEVMRNWEKYAKLYAEGRYHFAEVPVLFDYERFEIRPWTNTFSYTQFAEPPRRQGSLPCTESTICVDLAELYPQYAVAEDETVGNALPRSKTYPFPLVWQSWRSATERFDQDLFGADALALHPEAVTIKVADLFFGKEQDEECLDRAARAFATHLRDSFGSDTLIWLVPDSLHDLQLDTVRRNLNAAFAKADQLPRSVAAVMTKVNYDRLHEGMCVLVVDSIGGRECATRLEARFDRDLLNRVPATKGFYWERHPTVLLSDDALEPESQLHANFSLPTIDTEGKWRGAAEHHTCKNTDNNFLRKDPRIGNFAWFINITESPVSGALKLHELQQQAGDIPLWRDQIPELSIKALGGGRYKRFYLVSRGTTIRPIRGETMAIPVEKPFELGKGRVRYQLPLFVGEGEDDLGWSAKLESPCFPLQHDLVCRLNMTFTYGADQPYELVFDPLDSSIPPIRVKWDKTREEIVNDAPAPLYPDPVSWSDLMAFPSKDGSATKDLLDWAVKAFESLNLKLNMSPSKRFSGTIVRPWMTDRKGYKFTFVECDELGKRVFIHENSFAEGFRHMAFDEGDEITFEVDVKQYNGKSSGIKVADHTFEELLESRVRNFDTKGLDAIISHIHKALYFPMIQIWRDGRSLEDADCPEYFKDKMKGILDRVAEMLQEPELPGRIKDELFFLLSCTHRDLPEFCVSRIDSMVGEGKVYDKRALGFSLGDISLDWQGNVVDRLLANHDSTMLIAFANAMWRDRSFVEYFNCVQCQIISTSLLRSMREIKPCPAKDEGVYAVARWVRSTVNLMELLLGLLRTRSSSVDEIRMLLQPHQKITKEFAVQVERVTDLFFKSGQTLFSRVQLGNLPPKPEGDTTPDLLYALRLYLTNDVGANAIRITGITDDDMIG